MKAAANVAIAMLIAMGLGCSESPPAQSSCFSDAGPSEDPASTEYEARREALFDLTVEAEPQNSYSEVIRLRRGVAPDESKIRFDLDRLTARLDTSDFKLPALLWMMYEYADSDLLSEELLTDAKSVLLKHKYWPDERLNETEWLPPLSEPPDNELWEPTSDSMVYVTENHFILYATSAYLVGQLYPDELFEASGETGREKMETFRPRVMRWLELRYASGFSEWLSNVYYDEDIPGLVALVEFAEDEEIRTRAAMVLDLILADMALNQYEGNFGSTHGRTYEGKMSGLRDNTGSTAKLIFDLNEFRVGNMSSSALALSTSYVPPYVLWDMAHDRPPAGMENRQRMGIRLEEAESWGLDVGRFEDGMTFMTLEAYTHPLTIGLWVEMLDAYGWWVHEDYNLFLDFEGFLRVPELRDRLATSNEEDITRNMRPEVNIYTYRTPHYMLSTAQDWRKGFGGDQQSNWQATLGMEAVAFTNHPATERRDGDTPRYWTGYGTMPRVIQVKNVAISLYDVADPPAGLYVPADGQPLFTHAFLPRDKFDQTEKEGGWFFARKGADRFLALWASDPEADWEPMDPEQEDRGVHEIIACPSGYPENHPGAAACQGREGLRPCENQADCDKTIWIVELGSTDDYVDYEAFKDAIIAASLDVNLDALTVEYDSPSQGRLVVAWEGPLTQDGVPVDVGNYPRYDNAYGKSEFRDDEISFCYDDPEAANRSLILDFEAGSRVVSHDLY